MLPWYGLHVAMVTATSLIVSFLLPPLEHVPFYCRNDAMSQKNVNVFRCVGIIGIKYLVAHAFTIGENQNWDMAKKDMVSFLCSPRIRTTCSKNIPLLDLLKVFYPVSILKKN